MTVLIVGTSLRCGSRIDNCAVVIHGGRIFGVFPKTYPPTYREFYEARHFASGARLTGLDITIGPTRCPLALTFSLTPATSQAWDNRRGYRLTRSGPERPSSQQRGAGHLGGFREPH
jgi:hypothetical protein